MMKLASEEIDMKKEKKFIYTTFIFIITAIVLAGCTSTKNDTSLQPVKKQEQMELDETHFSERDEHPNMVYDNVREITLSALGDVLIHDRVYDVAETKDGYDFLPMTDHVKSYMGDATITFANQESVIGGEKVGLSSYPSFNSPYEIGDALKEDGVDIVSMANNHTLDRGEEAIQSAISHWEEIDMMYTGAYKNNKDASRIRVIETDEGMDVAFIAYTYGTNGIDVPEGKDYLVNYIDKKQIKKDIKEARDEADVVVLSLHFGIEYERMPNNEQKELMQFAADEGVDITLGHHPHVLQPVEWVEGENGNEMFAIYSLGNFLSGQDKPYTQTGGILNLTIQQKIKDGESSIEVKDPTFLPTYVDIDEGYKVYPMFQLNDDQLSDSKKKYEDIKSHMSQWMPELEFIED